MDANVTRCQSLNWSLDDMLASFPHLSDKWRERVNGVLVGMHLVSGLYTPRGRVAGWLNDHSVPNRPPVAPTPSGRPTVTAVDFDRQARVSKVVVEGGLYFDVGRQGLSARLARVESLIGLVRSSGYSQYRGIAKWLKTTKHGDGDTPPGRDALWNAEVQLGIYDLHQILRQLRPDYRCTEPTEYDTRTWDVVKQARREAELLARDGSLTSPLKKRIRRVTHMANSDPLRITQLGCDHPSADKKEEWVSTFVDSLVCYSAVRLNNSKPL